MQKTFKIVITGRVQGVGFRPHVYVLAREYGLSGSVSNNEEGVIIFVTGPEEVARDFYTSLINKPSKASRILEHSIHEIDHRSFENFHIVPSEKGSKLNLQLTPDFAICETCASEITDKDNRRYNYPFTTCVHCGPRWAVTVTFPFERENTTLDPFTMCTNCMEEYTDPENRRFHSQTNSCPECGIKYRLVNNNGDMISEGDAAFPKMAELLADGNILAIKNTGGYLLCCDATSAETVNRLRTNKHRPDKPFALMYPSLSMVKNDFIVSSEEEQLLTSTERPIVILSAGEYRGEVRQENVAPGLTQLGVMLPYSGIMQLLANELQVPIVATSGNLHGSPILSSEKESEEKLAQVADYFFHHNLPIVNPQDDSVVKFTSNSHLPVMFRRSRGYAPNFSKNEVDIQKKVIALGGNLKSTIAVLPNDYIYSSEYLGVLDNLEVYERFMKDVAKQLRIFEQQPDVILVDKHPAYLSTQYGKELAAKLNSEYVEIQHHEAHFAAVLGEHQLFNSSEKVMGVIWDGTGYGNDGAIWGGEFFMYEKGTMDRIAHFDYFEWLAGDKMAKEPRLSLFSLSDNPPENHIALKFSEEEFQIYETVKKNNKLKTSSVGRLFDAVASLLGIADHNTYEGRAAILLENRIDSYSLSKCRSYASVTDPSVGPTHEMWKNLTVDHRSGASEETIITNFLYTLATSVLEMANLHNVRHIAFSGGVFQNTILVDMIIDIVGGDHKLYFHQKLSPNDENISLGQLMHYLYCEQD